MKLVTRYVLKEHAGPLAFALTALTSLLLLQYIARQFEKLVGKGLPWRVIGEFFMLSLPFTIAMTMPMAVLVATLYAFGRMAAEHEITAFKASGVRVRTLMTPVLIASALIAIGMILFNDQVLPRANHRLAILTGDIASAKPTLALRPQVINQVTPTFFMRVGRLDERSNRMKDVVIYDVTNPTERQTIYADSGYLQASPTRADLDVILYDGVTQRFARGNPQRLERVFFRAQAVRVRDIYRNFSRTSGEQSKGEREMSVCEMETEYFDSAIRYEKARRMYLQMARDTAAFNQIDPAVRGTRPPPKRRVYRGLGTTYCRGVQLVERAVGIPTARKPGVMPPATPVAPAVATPSVTPATPPVATPAPGDSTAVVAVPVVPPPGSGLGATVDTVVRTPGATTIPQPPAATQAPGPVLNAHELPANVVRVKPGASQPQVPVPPVKPDSAKRPDRFSSLERVGRFVLPATLGAQPPASTGARADSTKPTPGQAPATGTQPAAATPQAASPTPPPATPVPAPAPAQPARTDSTTPGTTVVGATPGAPVIPPAPNAGTSTGAPAVVPSAGSPDQPVGSFVSPSITMLMDEIRYSSARMDQYDVEIQKKFALAVACFVFVLFGPPIALRFPRSGVGATIGVSLVVFGLYYCCLMAGEALADRHLLPAWIAMWGANVIFTIAALILLWRVEQTADTSRGGGLVERFNDWRTRRQLQRARSAPRAVSLPSGEPA
ncbi:MAG: LptF/LptG family permease [Gemmatimonadaceae bacterium]|nr:LptF/LptG family permease [Gemmatimonadaceae bacterium]